MVIKALNVVSVTDVVQKIISPPPVPRKEELKVKAGKLFHSKVPKKLELPRSKDP